jgi:hypothetical protein
MKKYNEQEEEEDLSVKSLIIFFGVMIIVLQIFIAIIL